MYICAKKRYRVIALLAMGILLCSAFMIVKNKYSNADFGASFGNKATAAQAKLISMQSLFETCTAICKTESKFMQSIVFPELMRYNSLKDGIEAESLRTLYVQLGKDYANFSIGIFQMKPSFAELVEKKSASLLQPVIQKELQLTYDSKNEEEIRRQRVERLQDEEWQLIYLTAFICICNETYKDKRFTSDFEKLQWYATLYNAGFDRSATYIIQKIKEENFYLQQQMPGKKFKYAAIAGWYYRGRNTKQTINKSCLRFITSHQWTNINSYASFLWARPNLP